VNNLTRACAWYDITFQFILDPIVGRYFVIKCFLSFDTIVYRRLPVLYRGHSHILLYTNGRDARRAARFRKLFLISKLVSVFVQRVSFYLRDPPKCRCVPIIIHTRTRIFYRLFAPLTVRVRAYLLLRVYVLYRTLYPKITFYVGNFCAPARTGELTPRFDIISSWRSSGLTILILLWSTRNCFIHLYALTGVTWSDYIWTR
jgi:hypothetical protein